ncbi:RecX family transcriptional regulator [Roseivirga sp. 4D4]|uniref:regulatory protein RecX n=1 Tax=Roseivirga sp. 4D4 TaxID=1889784 RepID=UPI0008532CE6|nr:RecX family transcriptional regulator [Roseivirga sp. 4D4]OEK02854.1 RecX family transcriptional regulator [Roseivirga sp. 4D4]
MHDFESRKRKKPIDRKTALLKAADYCAYQERSQQEVRDKLYSYGLHHDEVEETISELITDGYINEERFAKAYAGGKFRIKGWGRRKIIQGLKQHRISEYCIKKGMLEIDPDDYFETLIKHLEKKKPLIKSDSMYILKGKLTQHVMAKGFEMDLIQEAIKHVLSKED